MSLSAQISISKDDATPAVAELMASTTPERLARICRDPLRAFWRDRLKKYPRLPGPFAAFPPTGFGEAAADSVEGFVGIGTILLTANKQGLRAQYEGATIRPVNAKVLCFGITPESYGKSYAEMRARLGARAVVKHSEGPLQPGQKRGKPVKRDRSQLEINAELRRMFAFARQVTLLGNLAVVPTNDEFQEVAMAAILRRLAASPGGAN
jgi:hypothetical protein